MAITFTNNWKNILDKLQSIFRKEFRGILKVNIGKLNDIIGTQYLEIIPTGSELIDYNVKSETREYSIDINVYFHEKNNNKIILENILRYIARIEALVHDNVSMTLSDSTKVYNCRIESTVLDEEVEEDDIYLVKLTYKCLYMGNLD